MTKRITIQSGDFVLLSDIPNEQVFNLVKECFVNAGFPSLSDWNYPYQYSAFYTYKEEYSCFTYISNPNCARKLSLSDVFNSTNGDFDWMQHTSPMFQIGSGDDTRVLVCYDGIVIKRIHTVSPVYRGTVDYSHIEVKAPDTYKISKLCDLNNLQHTDIKLIQGRAIGKSTAHHLELISKAMKNPEQWVKVYSDHFDSKHCNRHALDEVCSLCHKLGLDWMEFSVSLNSIRYIPYQTVKMVTKWEVIA